MWLKLDLYGKLLLQLGNALDLLYFSFQGIQHILIHTSFQFEIKLFTNPHEGTFDI